jgi:hypothetical protein
VRPRVTPPPPPAAPKANAKRAARIKAQEEAAKAKALAQAQQRAQTKAKAKAKARAAAQRRARLARERAREDQNRFKEAVVVTPPPPTLTQEQKADPVAMASGGESGQQSDLLTSPLIRVLVLSAAVLALMSILLAALPLGALERLLAAEAHYRTEEVANFVDGHRLDIAVAGVATLLVAAVVAIPTVTG